MVGGSQDQIRAFCLGLPYGLGCLYAVFLGKLVFGQNNAVPCLLIAYDSHRDVTAFGVRDHLYGSKITVLIYVEDYPFHGVMIL